MRKLLILTTLLISSLCANALSLYGQPDIEPAIEDIIRSYAAWQNVEFNGKIRLESLPVTPTVKMYMERDSLIQISLREPLVGEVGRADITPSRVTLVNKLKRTYCSESAAQLMELYPSFISDLQSIFLARVTVLGSGQLGYENFEAVSIEEDGEGGWILVPESKGIADLKYGYVVGPNSRTQALVAELSKIGSLEVLYSYLNGGMQMQIDAQKPGKKKFEVTFDFSSVKWGGSPMAPLNLSNYTRMDAKEFLKSVTK